MKKKKARVSGSSAARMARQKNQLKKRRVKAWKKGMKEARKEQAAIRIQKHFRGMLIRNPTGIPIVGYNYNSHKEVEPEKESKTMVQHISAVQNLIDENKKLKEQIAKLNLNRELSQDNYYSNLIWT